MFEIESLAAEDLSIKAKEESSPSPTKESAELAATPKATSSALSAEPPVSEFNEVLSTILQVTPSPSTPRKSTVTDPNDANIIRARIIGAKRTFAMNGEEQNEATSVLDEIATLVKRLCIPEATEAELRDTLREIAAQFSNVGQALSSFELLKSGLVDGLLEYVDIDGAVSSSVRRSIVYDVFSDTTIASPSPLVMLVKRLHESLGRLESFEVETAFGGMSGVGSSSASLARSMRIRLQAEEGEDIPKQISSLSVTIQAIATVQALHDYLRPRVADPMYLSGNSALQNMFAAYAASRGGAGGGSAARLIAALAGGPQGLSGPAARALTAASNAAAPDTPTPADASKQRRRSARLSGRPADEGTAEATSSNLLSTSAPEPSVLASGALPHMPLGMEFDDDYSDEEYDAEVFEEDMEEELARPAEKVVNMSMAPGECRWRLY